MPLSGEHASAADALLASYAAGGLVRPFHALVASHLAMKPESRAYVAALETIAAGVLDDDARPVSERESGIPDRGRRLAAIFGDRDHVTPGFSGDALFPSPLAFYVGAPLEALSWRTRMPGLKEIRLEDSDGCEASLLWIRAGRAMPSHTHHGMEATLVLKGSFSDALGHYGRGDMAVVDSDTDHKPVAGQDGDCICFAVSEGPVTLTGPVARLFSKLLGH
jgi:putative transcriptional regulator